MVEDLQFIGVSAYVAVVDSGWSAAHISYVQRIPRLGYHGLKTELATEPLYERADSQCQPRGRPGDVHGPKVFHDCVRLERFRREARGNADRKTTGGSCCCDADRGVLEDDARCRSMSE